MLTTPHHPPPPVYCQAAAHLPLNSTNQWVELDTGEGGRASGWFTHHAGSDRVTSNIKLLKEDEMLHWLLPLELKVISALINCKRRDSVTITRRAVYAALTVTVFI